jgi:hypothetical protein
MPLQRRSSKSLRLTAETKRYKNDARTMPQVRACMTVPNKGTRMNVEESPRTGQTDPMHPICSINANNTKSINVHQNATPPDLQFHLCFCFLGNPAALLISMSPSASHLEAFTNCTQLMNCFAAMTGKLIPASIHGKVESILFARAYSNAAAL